MWYWNKRNFEGLAAVARSIEHEPPWQSFADYLRLREQGLRPQSLTSLNQFILESHVWSTDERRRFVNWVVDVHVRHPDVHQLIPEPLKRDFLFPTLLEWKDREPGNGVPHRLLGCIDGDPQHFHTALLLNPSDDYSRYQLMQRELGEVAFQCHHLPHQFLGSPEHAIEILNHVAQRMSELSDRDDNAILQNELTLLRQLVEDWMQFQRESGDSFLAWCDQNDRQYEWSKSFYYSAPTNSPPE